MSYADKVEVMDLLINVLKEHEKSLDILISRAENLMEDNSSPKNLLQKLPGLRLKLKDWKEFCDRAIEAELVCFDLVDSTFYCNAITESKIYRYCEETPEILQKLEDCENNLVFSGISMRKKNEENVCFLNGKLSNGLELRSNMVKPSGEKQRIEYELDLLYTKNWLSRELGIHHDFIVRGNIDS